MLDDSLVIKQAIKLGCRAYLLKNADRKEILDTIMLVYEGGTRRNMLNKLGLKNTAGLVRTDLEFDLLAID